MRLTQDGSNSSPNRRKESGFVVSAELLMIAVILLVGLATGWVKLRDQSLAEIRDSISALNAYNVGISTGLRPYGTRWIDNTGTVLAPPASGAVTATFPGPVAYGTLTLTYDSASFLSTVVNDSGENENVIP